MTIPAVADFETEVREWFSEHGRTLLAQLSSSRWGEGSDDVSVFDDVSDDEQAKRLADVRAWQRAKFDAGYVTLSWDQSAGGRGWPSNYQRRFNEIEAEYDVPSAGELSDVSVALIAPTIEALGTPQQRQRFLTPLLRMDEFACQLFSEPTAGSDLAGVQTKAVGMATSGC